MVAKLYILNISLAMAPLYTSVIVTKFWTTTRQILPVCFSQVGITIYPELSTQILDLVQHGQLWPINCHKHTITRSCLFMVYMKSIYTTQTLRKQTAYAYLGLRRPLNSSNHRHPQRSHLDIPYACKLDITLHAAIEGCKAQLWSSKSTATGIRMFLRNG